MRKILFLILFIFIAFTARAQFHLGGQFNINFSNERTSFNNGSTNNKENAYIIKLQPKFYWNITDRMQIGTRLGFAFGRLSTGTIYDTDKKENADVVNRAAGWAISPFYGYRLLGWKRVGIWAEANAFFGQYYNVGNSSGTINEWGKQSEYGFQILPVIDFSLTESLALQLHLGVISLGWYGTRSDYPDKYVVTSTWDVRKGGFSGLIQGLMDYGIGIVKKL